METGLIFPDSLPVFQSLLLPDVAEELRSNTPLLALGLTKDTLAVGALAGYIDGSIFRILSLYVAPDYRRQGGGSLLMRTLTELLAHQAQLFSIEVSYTFTMPEHQTLAPFWQAMSFFSLPAGEDNIFIISLKDISRTPFFSGPNIHIAGEILPFSQVPDVYLSTADKSARRGGVHMLEQPLDKAPVERDLSVALVEGTTIRAFVVIDYSCAGNLTLAYAYNGQAGPAAMPALFQQALRLAAHKYPGDTLVAVQPVSRASSVLVRKLLPGAQPISFTFQRYLNEEFMPERIDA